MNIEIVPATIHHARAIKLREADAAECFDVFGCPPNETVEASVLNSDWAYTALVDGEIAAMWGAAGETLIGDAAMVWMLSGSAITRVPVTTIKESRKFVAAMLERYDFLYGYVDSRHTCALRWLVRIGFRLLAPLPLGPRALMFNRFEASR